MRNQGRKLTTLSLLVAVGILMQLIESFFPIFVMIPGYKIGLANIAGLFALYAYGNKEMVIVTALRVFISALATGTLFSVSFVLSCTGCFFSCIAVILTKKTKRFSIYGVSTAGAVCHTFGQIIAITFIYAQFFMATLAPILSALSVVSGLCIAYLSAILLRRLRKQEWHQANQEIGLE